MAWLAGVDGCRAGWFRVCREPVSQALRFDLIETVPELFRQVPQPAIVALDMPIGLPDSGSRACDKAARKCIGPRRSSVFPAPIRPSLVARSREAADVITRSVDGRGVGAQAWGIYEKVRSVDEALTSDPQARRTLFEVHPEVSFWAWNDQVPMQFSKKEREGFLEREALAENWLGRGIVTRARGELLKKEVADDDILDAIATLWTAHRIEAGTSVTLPDSPPEDPAGLPMRIVF